MRSVLAAGAIAALVAPGPASSNPCAAVQACQGIRDDARRLACYDQARAADAQLQPASAEPPVAATERATAPTEDLFGQEDRLTQEVRKESEKRIEEMPELRSTVAKLAKHANGSHVITLENGQVWAQKSAEPQIRLKIGEPVRIERALMGSFILYSSTGWSTRVNRLR